ncbi:MAG: hypothetical protein GVY26_15670 [Bacteroidetes bacterium]|jgi:antagonist of KipI|nr:hypothetical protein [Bacteroidota bacterium]
MPKLHIITPGLHTTLQDLGRSGYQDKGVPVGGALDLTSATLANQLVGNPIDAPVLEMVIKGPVLHIEGSVQVALTGADLSPTFDGVPLPMYENVRLPDGGELRFGRLQSGCRAYLAVRGEWQAQAWLSSVSPPAHGAELLTPNSILQKGHVLEVLSTNFLPKRFYPSYAQPNYQTLLPLRVLPGPEYDQFDDSFLQWFFGRNHRISPDSNRMGYRLDEAGPALDWTTEMISSAVLPGTIQVTGGGKVMILMADAQTTGGYPRLGVMPGRELARLAQWRPGLETGFRLERLASI